MCYKFDVKNCLQTHRANQLESKIKTQDGIKNAANKEAQVNTARRLNNLAQFCFKLVFFTSWGDIFSVTVVMREPNKKVEELFKSNPYKERATQVMLGGLAS